MMTQQDTHGESGEEGVLLFEENQPESSGGAKAFSTADSRLIAREEMPSRPAGLWLIAPWALFLLGAALVLLTQSGVGYAWDESYYYEPSRKAGRWASLLFSGSTEMLSREAIHLYWEERSEHPSFHKLVTGASLLLLEERWDPILAMRLPAALLFGATLGLIHCVGFRLWNAPAGLVAAVAYGAMPRVFGHAHFSSIETPLNFSIMLLIYCFIRGLHSRAWAAACGVAFGLLLATKINAFFAFPPLLLWGHCFARRRYANNLFSILTLGPLCFVLFWPWLWHDTPVRILEYLYFHAAHQQTAVFFLGRKWGYGAENAPWFYPSVMLGVTLPIGILLLSALGLLLSVLHARRKKLPLLILLFGATMWIVASAPQTPKYDGIRLFLPLFPCIALMAGGAVASLLDLIGAATNSGWFARHRSTVLAGMIVIALAAEGAWGILRMHPYHLSYFNPLVGGLPGAHERGFETTYWGEAVNDEVVEALNRMIPDGERLKVLALHELNFLQLQQWGKLKSSIDVVGPPPYYAHLVLHRAGFHGRPELALIGGEQFPRMIRWSHQGVPLVTLYRTGPAFETFWPQWRQVAEPNSAPGEDH
jgi:4-amino-4-deoxy-L-arabinose transferase-like glycosyltransferase